MERVVWFEDIGMNDVARVGGKNASLGEMIGSLAASGVRVPGGFATTADAFREFIAHNALEARISDALATLDVEDVAALAAAGERIRRWVSEAELPAELEQAVRAMERATELDPRDPIVWGTQAQIRLVVGQGDRALDDVERALGLALIHELADPVEHRLLVGDRIRDRSRRVPG